MRDRGWPTRTDRHQTASEDDPRLAQPDRDSDRRRPEAAGHPSTLGVGTGVDDQPRGGTDRRGDRQHRIGSYSKEVSSAWGQAGVTTESGVEGEGEEAMIISPVAAGRRQQDGARWWHIGGE
ncbi:hypothetical protein BN903_439 [Halorubrum sp. AJ67]|nr:hypothetical protein BN903_439 [Halorubrum sp. AJ67]